MFMRARGSLGFGRRWSGTGAAAGGGTPDPPAKTVLQASDFTCLGAFALPASPDPAFAGGLTHRYVGGQLRLYTFPSTGGSYGQVYEFAVPPDGNLKTSAPFTAATLINSLGDIYQDALYSVVTKGLGTPPFTGLAGGLVPNGLFWDETDQRMYWTYTSGYNDTEEADNVVGYSTLNDQTHTGTGVGMWKLVSAANGNNRWANGLVSIPEWAASQLGGRRLGVGFGGFYSVCGNGPVSAGPALFAVDPSGFTAGTNRDYCSIAPTKLMLHPFGTVDTAGFHRPPRDPSLACYNDYTLDGAFRGRTDIWNWSDVPPVGVWIDTATTHGFVVCCLLSGGNVQTTVSATPAPSALGCRVADATGLHVGDYIRVVTEHTDGQAEYPYAIGSIATISGNDLTFTALENAWPSGVADPGAPKVGGELFAGAWYVGGGNAASNWWTPWYIYDPADLVAVGLGTQAADTLVPASCANVALPHRASYPIPGGGPNQSPRPCRPLGATYDGTTKRLYVVYGEAYQAAQNDRRALVYVYEVNG